MYYQRVTKIEWQLKVAIKVLTIDMKIENVATQLLYLELDNLS